MLLERLSGSLSSSEVSEGPIRGLLGRDDGSETGRMGWREPRRPNPVILPRTLRRLEESDRAERAGDGGERSGRVMSGMLDRQ